MPKISVRFLKRTRYRIFTIDAHIILYTSFYLIIYIFYLKNLKENRNIYILQAFNSNRHTRTEFKIRFLILLAYEIV